MLEESSQELAQSGSPGDLQTEQAGGPSGSPYASEDGILVFLKRTDLQGADFEQLTRSSGFAKSRKVKLAMAKHPRAPRHITLPLLRELFTFDLMNVALAHSVPADIRIAAEEALMKRTESLSAGERLTLARRASGRVAGSLLSDEDARVIRAALENSRLTEALVIKALNRRTVIPQLVESVSNHCKWSVRREIRISLLRCQELPLARALLFANSLPAFLVREILHGSKLPASTKRCLEAQLPQQI